MRSSWTTIWWLSRSSFFSEASTHSRPACHFMRRWTGPLSFEPMKVSIPGMIFLVLTLWLCSGCAAGSVLQVSRQLLQRACAAASTSELLIHE